MKPGYRTTEFWLSLAAMVVTLLYSAGVIVEGSTAGKAVGFVAAALVALGYSVSRSLVKKNPPPE